MIVLILILLPFITTVVLCQTPRWSTVDHVGPTSTENPRIGVLANIYNDRDQRLLLFGVMSYNGSFGFSLEWDPTNGFRPWVDLNNTAYDVAASATPGTKLWLCGMDLKYHNGFVGVHLNNNSFISLPQVDQCTSITTMATQEVLFVSGRMRTQKYVESHLFLGKYNTRTNVLENLYIPRVDNAIFSTVLSSDESRLYCGGAFHGFFGYLDLATDVFTLVGGVSNVVGALALDGNRDVFVGTSEDFKQYNPQSNNVATLDGPIQSTRQILTDLNVTIQLGTPIVGGNVRVREVSALLAYYESSWIQLARVDGSISTAVIFQNELYIGGNFYAIGCKNITNKIARRPITDLILIASDTISGSTVLDGAYGLNNDTTILPNGSLLVTGCDAMLYLAGFLNITTTVGTDPIVVDGDVFLAGSLDISVVQFGNITVVQGTNIFGTFDQVTVHAPLTTQSCEKVQITETYTSNTFMISTQLDTSACGLSTGVIVGIAVGVFVFVGLAVFLPLAIIRFKTKQKTQSQLNRLADVAREQDNNL